MFHKGYLWQIRYPRLLRDRRLNSHFLCRWRGHTIGDTPWEHHFYTYRISHIEYSCEEREWNVHHHSEIRAHWKNTLCPGDYIFSESHRYRSQGHRIRSSHPFFSPCKTRKTQENGDPAFPKPSRIQASAIWYPSIAKLPANTHPASLSHPHSMHDQFLSTPHR